MRFGEPPRVGCHRRTTWVPRPRRSRSSSACCCACATRPAPSQVASDLGSDQRQLWPLAVGAAFDSSYAPARADVSAVQDWLRSQGFRVTKTLPSGMLVEASGSVTEVEQTFGAQAHNYSYQGKTVRANARRSLPGSTPAAVSGAIAGVIGIDQGSTLKQPADTEPGPPPGARYGVQPCSGYYGQKIADRPAARVRRRPAVRGLRIRAAAVPVRPTASPACWPRGGRPRGHGGDHRRLRRADDLPDAQHYNKVHHQPGFIPASSPRSLLAPDGYDTVI